MPFLTRLSGVAVSLSFTVILSLSLAGVAQANQLRPASYNCTSNPSTSSGHCYAQGYWNEGVTGATSHIKIVSMSESPGFVTDEQWASNNKDTLWVEAGIFTGNANGYEGQFWADERPGSPMNYHIHYGPGFNASDFGGQLYESIRSDGGSGYNVVVNSPSMNYSGHSYPDNFSIASITIGMEVYGTSGLYVDPNGGSITYNGWWNSAGTLSYQRRMFDGTNIINPPINAYWQTVAAPGNNGGNWIQKQTGS